FGILIHPPARPNPADIHQQQDEQLERVEIEAWASGKKIGCRSRAGKEQHGKESKRKQPRWPVANCQLPIARRRWQPSRIERAVLHRLHFKDLRPRGGGKFSVFSGLPDCHFLAISQLTRPGRSPAMPGQHRGWLESDWPWLIPSDSGNSACDDLL